MFCIFTKLNLAEAARWSGSTRSSLPVGEGKITESVNLGSYHGGAFTKTATIMSDAKNAATMQVSIHFTIKAWASVTPSYIQLTKDKNGKIEVPIVFSSESRRLRFWMPRSRPMRKRGIIRRGKMNCR